MKFGVVVVYKKLSNRIKFSENQRNEYYTLLKGINEFLPLFSALFYLGEIQCRICPQKFVELL